MSYRALVLLIFADVAQRLECDLAKVDVVGSNPIIRLDRFLSEMPKELLARGP